MERYAEGFVDNGYEDFETVKQMGRADLETVGVADYHMEYMLSAVAVLQQKARAYWLVDFFSRPFSCFFLANDVAIYCISLYLLECMPKYQYW